MNTSENKNPRGCPEKEAASPKNSQAEGSARKKLLMAADLIILAATAFCIIDFFTGTGDGNMMVKGTKCFMFFTIDSNVLAAIASALVLAARLSGRGIS